MLTTSVVLFLVAELLLIECQNDFFIVKDYDSGNYYCVTNSSFALSRVKDGITKKLEQQSKFVTSPVADGWSWDIVMNDRNRRFYPKQNWETVATFSKEVVLDRRWEEIEVYMTESVDTNDIETIFKIPKFDLEENFIIPISLRIEKDAHIYLCSYKVVALSNCYWLMLQAFNGSKTELRKCKPREISGMYYNLPKELQCTDVKYNRTHSSDFPSYLSSKTWRHFILQKKNNQIILTQETVNDSREIMRYDDDQEAIKVKYIMFSSNSVNGFWKLHTLQYLHARKEMQYVTIGPEIKSINNIFCISMFVMMCSSCKLKLAVSLKDDGTEILKQQTFGPYESWSEIKFIERDVNEKKLYLLVATINDDKDNDRPFWAIDAVRQCQPNEFRFITLQKDEKCQLISKNSNDIISLNQELSVVVNDCPEDTVGTFCLPCSWLLGKHKCGRLKICAQAKCFCSAGYKASNGRFPLNRHSDCINECDSYTYGHGCKQTCGRCKIGICSNIDGICNGRLCKDSYSGPRCKISPPVRFSNAPKLISVNYSEAIVSVTDFQISNEAEGNQPESYFIQYKKAQSTFQNWTSVDAKYQFKKEAKITIKNLKSNTKYCVRSVITQTQNNLDYYIPHAEFTTLWQATTTPPKVLTTAKLEVFQTSTVTVQHSTDASNLSSDVPPNGETLSNFFVTKYFVLAIFLALLAIVVVGMTIVCSKRHLVRSNCDCIKNRLFTSEVNGGQKIFSEQSIPFVAIPNDPQDQLPYQAYSKLVKTTELEKYVIKSIENDDLQRQYESLPPFQPILKQRGSLKKNVVKNRNPNIIAYDSTRVVLNTMHGDPYSDYINANYINGYKVPRAYIATQGPKLSTVNDFWRMIWQENVRFIVTLANVYEDATKMFEKYWPEEKEKLQFCDILVQRDSIEVFADYEVRVFTLKHGHQITHIHQYHFMSWAKDSVPLCSQSIVPFVQMINKLPLDSNSPVVVHSSVGCGRTGTIILSDISLRMAAEEGTIDMLKTLRELRSQRPNMVNRSLLYKFAHVVVLECLCGIQTSIAVNDLSEAVPKLLKHKNELRSQKKYLETIELQDRAFKSEMQRETQILPGNNESMVSINISSPNAVLVDGFRCPNKFLVIQQSGPDAVDTFWRSVDEHGASVIISLNKIYSKNKKEVCFWPNVKHQTLNPGKYLTLVHAQTESASEFYEIITVNMRLITRKKYDTIKIIALKNWSPKDDCPKSIKKFLKFYEESFNMIKESKPVVVACFDGVLASGLYVALSWVIEKIKFEQVCDVCQSVRVVRQSRREFVRSEEQFTFLYRTAMTYAKLHPPIVNKYQEVS